jgi:hypothetical protein
MKKTTKTDSVVQGEGFTSLSIKKSSDEDQLYSLITCTHNPDGSVSKIETGDPLPYHLVVHSMKLSASRLWRP